MSEVDMVARARRAVRGDKRTPRWLVNQAAARFGPFDADAAAHAENAVAPVWFGPGSAVPDALAVPWSWDTAMALLGVERPRDGRPLSLWCNPEYGPAGTIAKWIAHARRQRDAYHTRTTFLLPADVSTVWYRDCARSELVENLPFRVPFDSPDGSTLNTKTGRANGAEWPNCVVVIAAQWTRPKFV